MKSFHEVLLPSLWHVLSARESPLDLSRLVSKLDQPKNFPDLLIGLPIPYGPPTLGEVREFLLHLDHHGDATDSPSVAGDLAVEALVVYHLLSVAQHRALGGSVWSLLYRYDDSDTDCAVIAAATGIDAEGLRTFTEVGEGLDDEQQLVLMSELCVSESTFQRAVSGTKLLAQYGAGVPRGERFPVGLFATINRNKETPAMLQHHGGQNK